MEKFVGKHLRLLEKERETEIEETRCLTEKLPIKELQRRGICLPKLCIVGRRTGFYGRIVITFEMGRNQQELPSHKFTPGDIAGLSQSSGEQPEDIGSGIVTRASKTSVCIAFDDNQDLFLLSDDGPYKLQKLANDVTYKRLKKALRELQSLPPCPVSQLVGVLFGERELTPPYITKEITFVNQNLDDSQREAVRFALSQPEVAVIHGPPGTGKTTTVVEAITQAVKLGNKVLTCAPSNIAVDNLVERLARNKLKIVRLGHPARVLPHIQKYSLDAILANSEETKLVEDVRKDIDKAWSQMKKTRDKGEKHTLRGEMKFLRKELAQREQAATKEILKRADVVLATLTSASPEGPIKFLDANHFNLTVIDECSQAIEVACWIPLMRAPRCVLAGDHLQLPPTILSQEAAKDGLEVTLMERIIDLYHTKVIRMLTTQYRMHQLIMQWSSDQLYHSKLTAHPTVAGHLLGDMEGVNIEEEEASFPLLMIDTAGCDLNEMDTPEEISKGNEGEADIVSSHVERLITIGVKQQDIAVIAPYNLQVELLRLRIWPKFPDVEIKSVDGFQGREKEAVIITLVRSNRRGEVGFLSERRRINVAVTRARRHLAVICDSETVSHDEFLKSLVDYMASHGEVQTAQDYIDSGVFNNKSVRPEHLDDLLTLNSVSKSKGSGARPKSSVSKPKHSHSSDSRNSTTSAIGSSRDRRNRDNDKNICDEAMTEKKTEKYREILEKFVANADVNCMEFPPTLTSFERMLVHELAGKLSLTHVSKGEDKGRFIVVSKPGGQSVSVTTETSVQSTEVPVVIENTGHLDEIPSQKKEKQSDKLVCPHCNKDVIRANFSLHEIHCLRQQRDCSAKASEKSQKASSRKDQTKQQNGTKKLRPPSATAKIEKVDADDFDGLIAAAQKLDEVCGFKKCKVKVKTLGQNCEFCMRRFCLSHHIPEIHGCGEVAKAHARSTHIKEGVLYRSSTTKPAPPDPKRQAALHRKLDKKLSDLTSQRSKSGKKNNK
ncbi:DNA-binding protein SMUBP-2-like [Mizuhopecten yessoensis]|uniref:DNA-binding protein SMUBP-2 n=1 Tax=Mizuhopecten yessoensis TaxID=6573 RepID=A0A210PPT4_MIZYE|nr:DNA-binding protein SMUBP-2-like [Mizuhopecten yessoensis]OWF38482.1 DNA-binding protein SMUBP-2 [Mizuhopecten yessoensis]